MSNEKKYKEEMDKMMIKAPKAEQAPAMAEVPELLQVNPMGEMPQMYQAPQMMQAPQIAQNPQPYSMPYMGPMQQAPAVCCPFLANMQCPMVQAQYMAAMNPMMAQPYGYSNIQPYQQPYMPSNNYGPMGGRQY